MQVVSFLRQCDVEIESVEFRGVSLDGAPSSSQQGKPSEPLSDLAILFLAQKLLSGQLDRPLGHVNLALRLRVENRNSYALLVDRLEGEILLDTFLRSPVKLADKALLQQGFSEAVIETSLPLDSSLFKLTNVQNYRLRGVGSGLVQPSGKRLALEFDEERPLPDKIKQKWKSTKQSLIEEIFSSWMN